MASYVASATQVAHQAVVSLLSAAEVKVGKVSYYKTKPYMFTVSLEFPGSTIATAVPIKENAANETFTFENISGKNIFVGVPGAFTGTCSAQIPGYIANYEKFKEKGIKDIYVIAVNDVFTLKAWKESLAPAGTPVRFIADDKGAFVGSLGLLFDATPLLGAPRSKRFVIVTEGNEITHLAIEPVPSELTITAAEKILPLV